jgi:hypothetical protein
MHLQMAATLPTSKQRKGPREEPTSTMNHHDRSKSVTAVVAGQVSSSYTQHVHLVLSLKKHLSLLSFTFLLLTMVVTHITNSDSSWFHTFLPNCCVFEGTGGFGMHL